MFRRKLPEKNKRQRRKEIPRSFRKVVINGQDFYYHIGRGGIRIIFPDGKDMRVDLSTFSGWSWDAIERGTYKRYFSITPKYVCAWIESYLATLA